jgi:pimeloyl-ACP methyl ester carboxylesterase
MGAFLIRIADAFGLETPHVIGRDVGTAAALFAAALCPGRLRSIVVGERGYGMSDFVREDARPHRRGPLHLGRRSQRVRGARHPLVERSDHWIRRCKLIGSTRDALKGAPCPARYTSK